MPQQLDRVRNGDADPRCERCGGIQRSATVAFGQSLDPAVLAAAFEAAADCDEFWSVGTSLTVQPAAQLAGVAKEHGARLVIVNGQPTPYDDVADNVIRDPIGRALPRLVSSSA
jgi:NAD-dependent deacetylase